MSFKDDDGRESDKQYYLPNLELKGYNVMIYERNLFDQPVRFDFKKHDNIKEIAACQGDDYTVGCLLDSPYLKSYWNRFNKQQDLATDTTC